MIKPSIKWGIFSAANQALMRAFGIWPDSWGQGGHCVFSAITGALLTEAVTGIPCIPQCGGARITLHNGQVIGYTPEQVDFARGFYHSWFVVEPPGQSYPVDLRTVLVPDWMRSHLAMQPPTLPPFIWGDVPPWLSLQPQPEATATIQTLWRDALTTPLSDIVLCAALLLRHGMVAEAGIVLGDACRGLFEQVNE